MSTTDIRCARVRATVTACLLALVATLFTPAPADALRVVTYNVLNFPGTTGTEREPDFRTVVGELDADVIVVQEMLSLTGVNQFLNNILNYGGTGEYAAAPFTDGYDTDNAMYYRVSTVDFVSTQQIGTALRDISEYVVRPDGYSSTDAELRLYSVHLKAGSTSSDQDKRLAEVTILRNHTNALPSDSHFAVLGDFNIRSSTEDAYEKLVGSESDNDGRTEDPINRPGTWHDNYSFADIHTQSPRTAQFGGGATGGMDDRFDQILVSYALDDGYGLSYVTGSHVAYGNDGQHFNIAINSGTNYAVSAAVADAIHDAADHLPVYLDVQLPARASAPAALDFGNVIVGTSAEQALDVSNVATVPADDLTYTLDAPSGFTAPSGTFDVSPGSNGSHTITMDTSFGASRSGTLTVDSNDVDTPSVAVTLTGAVLDHAVASLSAASPVTSDTLDMGIHAQGEFPTGLVEISNDGYSSLQALLDVYDAFIAGGDDRFSIDGGFSQSLVGATAASYDIVFDDTGADAGTVYSATLTFSTRDDTSVTGWTNLSDLVVHLRAETEGGTGVPDGSVSRLALRLDSRNPFSDRVALALDLPTPSHAVVTVHDVNGRVVALLSNGGLPAGSNRLVWNGESARGGRVASGIYFCRAEVEGWTQSRKLLLIR